MKRIVLAACLLAGCTTVEPTTILMMYPEGGIVVDAGLDVAFVDAAIDAGQDSSEASQDASPEVDSYDPIDLDATQDTQPDDVAIEAAKPCVHAGESCEVAMCCGSLSCFGLVCTDLDAATDAATDADADANPQDASVDHGCEAYLIEQTQSFTVDGGAAMGCIDLSCPAGEHIAAPSGNGTCKVVPLQGKQAWAWPGGYSCCGNGPQPMTLTAQIVCKKDGCL